MTHNTPNTEAVRDSVRSGYTAIAQSGTWTALDAETTSSSCCSGGGCCGPSGFSADALAIAVGYSQAELDHLPEGANMGLSCGNPTAIASLRSGEVVVDLGSGGGFDCFLAGRRVGNAGRVIGVDMTPAMLTKARRNIDAYRRQSGLDNVEFRLGEIEHLPVADASVDVVMSNCVLNLSVDKPRVWREIARVLKPGGRVAISDLALRKPLPEAIVQNVTALVGCVAGAVLVDETRRQVAAAGLVASELTENDEYVRAMTQWQDPLYRTIAAALNPGETIADYITSLSITAVKP